MRSAAALAVAVAAVGSWAQSPGAPAAESGYASINGLRMYHEIHGSGPPLLLLHGGAGVISREWIDFLSADFRVVAMEQMGHGRTADNPAREFRYRDMADDTVALMDRLGIARAAVVGYSDGGIVALTMAIHHPDRVAQLVTTGASFHVDGYTRESLAQSLTVTAADWPASEDYARLSPDGKAHWPVLLGRLQRMWAAEPRMSRAQLGAIKAPTLVVVGDRDIVTPEHAVEMFRSIPGARLCVVPGAGHGVMPKEAVLAFLKGASGAQPR